MTFNQFLAFFGVNLITWLPIALLFYFAVRKAIEHGIRFSATTLLRAQDQLNRPKASHPSALTEDQRARIGEP